jgi:tetratricopeptide (TPR) repeat protein
VATCRLDLDFNDDQDCQAAMHAYGSSFGEEKHVIIAVALLNQSWMSQRLDLGSRVLPRGNPDRQDVVSVSALSVYRKTAAAIAYLYSPNPKITAECWQEVQENHQHFPLLAKIYEGWRVGLNNKSKFDMTNSPDVLWPIRGCRILVNPDTNQAYAMPIRALAPAIEQAVAGRSDAQTWYKYAIHNESLSHEQKIACIQRAVILEPNNPGWWYTLGCHYELEGKDWYGAANAFNHVIFLYPNSAPAWFSLGRLWAARGIMTKAQEAYARFQKLQNGEQKESAADSG